MAPPSNRRPGYSRKAQYGLFATYVLAIAGAIVAALLLIISIVDPKGFSALKTAGSEITAPVARFFNSVRQTFGDMAENTSAYFDAASKNAALNKEVEANRTKLAEAAALKAENARLKKLLAITDNTDAKPIIARLISSSATSSRRIGVLSEGSLSGIQEGQPIRGPEGLIGRVISTGPTTARLLLVSDADNVVPVKRGEDAIPAFASGLADGTVAIRPIDLGVNPFKAGDIIVTSGNGGLYPPDIPVARVIRKTGDGAVAELLAEPAASPYVLVMPVYQPEVIEAQQDGEASADNEAASGDQSE